MAEQIDPRVGLNPSQVAQRQANGQNNRVSLPTSRSYWDIFRENVFTFINNLLFLLGIALVLLGRASDAAVSVVVILVNVVVSVTQEIRAKRTLDKIALLMRPTATVVREGKERVVDPAEVVLDDILFLRPGDQVVADGVLVGEGWLEMDESLLTGEADRIQKHVGDAVYSGSFCAGGSARVQVQQVGALNLANQMTASARAYRRVLSPLQQQINLVIRVILLVAIYLVILVGVITLVEKIPLVESVKMSVVIIGLVPNGLFLAIAVAYALGALRIARKGALVQQANAMETLSALDVLCLDKTGTLTANRLRLIEVKALGQTDGVDGQAAAEILRARLSQYAASVSSPNRTVEALSAALPGSGCPLTVEIPFSSTWKWSGVGFAGNPGPRSWILGAPEVLVPALSLNAEKMDQVNIQREDWSAKGWRVLLVASTGSQLSPVEAGGMPTLPEGLALEGLLAFEDELRPEAREILERFAHAGVEVKVISGDSPETVTALARQVGLVASDGQANRVAVSGLDLAKLPEAEFEACVKQATVFGRITPQQKELILQTLRKAGRSVGMIGDGVNDVLALKQADLAIAMQSGSQATRAVADMVLMGDTFAVLPEAVQEGQRIVNGMQDILKLFMTRVFYVAILIGSLGMLGWFPYEPKHISILTFLTVGIPSIVLAAWARPAIIPRRSLLRRLFHFVFPASLTISLMGLLVFISFLLWDRMGLEMVLPYLISGEASLGKVAQTALTSFSILCGLLLIVFVEPPAPFWVGGDALSEDRRPLFLALGLLLGYSLVVGVPGLRDFFNLAGLSLGGHLVLLVLAMAWAWLQRWVWRSRILERYLSIHWED